MRCVRYVLSSLLFFSLVSGQAFASASFHGASVLSFALAGDVSDLLVETSGGYVDDGSSALFGDASVAPQYAFSSLSNAVFTEHSQVHDSLGQVVTARHLARFNIAFTNTGFERRSFSLAFNYSVSGLVSGEFADGSMQIAYGDAGFDELYVAVGFLSQSSVQGGAVSDFSLAAGERAEFSVSVGTYSNLLGSTPVPLPGAIWFYLTALAWLGTCRRTFICRNTRVVAQC